MNEMSSTRWLYQGSSVVFDKGRLGPLITQDCMISLREALGWLKAWPNEPGGDGKTVLVAGLEVYLDVMDVADAENLLRRRIKPFILEFQSRWDQCGLVFGFSQVEKFKTNTSDDEVLFQRKDRSQVRFSRFLWDGNATLDVWCLKDGEVSSTSKPTIGYHVRRIS
jgi:hypothetical protein